jgi:hypothetical protein
MSQPGRIVVPMEQIRPSIRIKLPPVEDFAGAVMAVRATGARPDPGRQRGFVIDGPMAVREVAALQELMGWVDGGSERARFAVTIDLHSDSEEGRREDAAEWWEECWNAWRR